MQQHKNHVVFDEINYDRNKLINFVDEFKDCVVKHSDWQKTLSGGTQSYEVPDGYNAIDTTQKEGKFPSEYPEVQELMSKFKIEIKKEHVIINHYDVGFWLRPHTDHACKCSIMFPILPDDGDAPLTFHDVSPSVFKIATDYIDYKNNIDYKMHYNMKHPTMFTTQVPHSVDEVKKERIYLKFMVFDYTFEQLIEMHKKGELIDNTK